MSEKRSRSADDHQSDPARVPGAGWVGEGGASSLGPATHTRPPRKHSAENTDEENKQEVEGEAEHEADARG